MGYRVESLKRRENNYKLKIKKIVLVFILVFVLISSIIMVDKSNTYLMGIDEKVFSYSLNQSIHKFEIFGKEYYIDLDRLYFIFKDKINYIKSNYL